jgi:hypothetical protein
MQIQLFTDDAKRSQHTQTIIIYNIAPNEITYPQLLAAQELCLKIKKIMSS